MDNENARTENARPECRIGKSGIENARAENIQREGNCSGRKSMTGKYIHV